MATQKVNQKKTLSLTFITAVDESGKTTLKTQNIQHFNPAVSDDDTDVLGKKIASLVKYELDSVSVTDKYEIGAV